MNPFIWIRNQSFFKDKTAVWMSIGGLVFVVVNLFMSVINIEQKPYKVPVRYSGYINNIAAQDEWFTLYVLPIFAVLVFAINLTLAIKIHRMNASFAQVIIGLTWVIEGVAFFVIKGVLSLL